MLVSLKGTLMAFAMFIQVGSGSIPSSCTQRRRGRGRLVNGYKGRAERESQGNSKHKRITFITSTANWMLILATVLVKALSFTPAHQQLISLSRHTSFRKRGNACRVRSHGVLIRTHHIVDRVFLFRPTSPPGTPWRRTDTWRMRRKWRG